MVDDNLSNALEATVGATKPRARGRKPIDFVCPECAARATGQVIGYPVPSNRDHEYRRRYTCQTKRGGCGNTFDSVERVLLPELAHVQVMSNRNDRLGRFDRSKLVTSMHRRIVKTLTTAELDALIDGVLQNLRDVVQPSPSGSSSVDKPIILVPDIQKAVFDTIRQAAQRRDVGDTRQRLKVAMIQYALGSYGERSRSHSRWGDARDFLTWMNQEHEMFGKAVQPPDQAWTADTTPWIVPTTLPPVTPTLVVKNFRPTDIRGLSLGLGDADVLDGDAEALVRRRRQDTFDADRIRTSLNNALYGRRSRALDTERIFTWLMWGFPGQRVLRTSQISSRIAETLRALDDIAYLRWVVIGKELTASQIRAEAEGLIAYPSQRLQLSRSKLPPPMGQEMRSAGSDDHRLL